MHRVVIEHIGPMEAVGLKNQLLEVGLIINQDFIWEYRHATYDNDGFTPVTPKQVTFNFTDAPLATFYKLKWT